MPKQNNIVSLPGEFIKNVMTHYVGLKSIDMTKVSSISDTGEDYYFHATTNLGEPIHIKKCEESTLVVDQFRNGKWSHAR